MKNLTSDQIVAQFKYNIPQSSFEKVITDMTLENVCNDEILVYRFSEVLVCYDTRTNRYTSSRPILEGLTEVVA